MRTVVAKFGGTSLADAGQFRKIKDIVSADPDRRVLVVSAPGKRFPEDIKVTDLLAECYEEAAAGKDFHAALSRVKARYSEILSGLSLDFPLDEEIKELEKHLAEAPEMAYTESRGEYLNARIMAQYLGFTFVDPAWCVCFHEDGTPDDEMTRRAMQAALRPLERAVVAGFYGADGNGKIHTFSRGGSDVTGSLAACAVHADLYENWTDVSGLLAADLTRGTKVCREQMEPIVDFLREYVPGYEHCFLLSSASLLGIRETRHFHGRYTLTHQDILDKRVFEDWVVRDACFNFDVHNITGAGLDKTGAQKYFPKDNSYTIPYRSLLPQEVQGLLLAGRNISGSHMAHSNYRAMPICVGMGEAAGIAAALCCRENILPEQADVKEIQDCLLKD